MTPASALLLSSYNSRLHVGEADESVRAAAEGEQGLARAELLQEHATPAENRRLGRFKSWLRVDAAGVKSELQADKHTISARCAVPIRDLRILDSDVIKSFSTALLSRERTIVVNLEHVKARARGPAPPRRSLIPPPADAHHARRGAAA